jgi:membrane protease YdiL (CAAX protease family)
MTTPGNRAQLVLIVWFPLVAIGLLNGLWVESLHESNPRLFWASDLSHFLVLPVIGLLVLGRFARIWPRDYGFRSLGSEYSLPGILGLFVLVSFLFWLFYYPVRDIAYRLFWESAGTFWYDKALPTRGIDRLLVATYFSATAALMEEVVYRSLPWLYFSLRFPSRRFVVPYVLVTSSLFGLIHWEQGPHGVIAAFSLGLIAAFLYSKLQNIWPFVVAHFLADAVAFS